MSTQIYHAPWAAQKLARLDLLRESIHALWPSGHPTRLISVAGTSGKGSTSRFLETALATAGSAGAFMSPHIFDYRERFSLNGEFAAQDDIARLWETRIQPRCRELALRSASHAHSFHEVGILMALALFDEHNIEWAAMEAGLGGRYDQTRALDVRATVLTNVGSDHAHLLGSEPWQRVLDKAGIARTGAPFFTSETNADSLAIIESVCQYVGAPLHSIGMADATRLSRALDALPGKPHIAEPLINGAHQRTNAALALATARHLLPDLDEARVLAAFRDARLLGRFWPIEQGPHAGLYIDIGAQRRKGARAGAAGGRQVSGAGQALRRGRLRRARSADDLRRARAHCQSRDRYPRLAQGAGPGQRARRHRRARRGHSAAGNCRAAPGARRGAVAGGGG